ncbi:MAG: hypothetical protein EON57_03850 [Alphaproteobacteria bacterium]|nr:MAG: hypothetical protein EON57_03850 [Alphaproteobacteria bacterium]
MSRRLFGRFGRDGGRRRDGDGFGLAATLLEDELVAASRDGKVLEPDPTDPRIIGTRAAYDMIGTHPRLQATALQTVGSKGWDGFAIMVVE